MAYDPEARQTSNSAMIIGIIALVVVAGAVLAYYATQQPKAETGTNTTIVNNRTVPVPTTNTVIIAPTVVPTPNTVVVPGKTVTRVERRNTTVNRTIERKVPAPSASSQPSGSSNTTINIAPPANTGSGSSGATNSGTSGDGTSGNSAVGSTDTGTSATDSATGTDNSVANDAANDATSNSASGY